MSIDKIVIVSVAKPTIHILYDGIKYYATYSHLMCDFPVICDGLGYRHIDRDEATLLLQALGDMQPILTLIKPSVKVNIAKIDVDTPEDGQ